MTTDKRRFLFVCMGYGALVGSMVLGEGWAGAAMSTSEGQYRFAAGLSPWALALWPVALLSFWAAVWSPWAAETYGMRPCGVVRRACTIFLDGWLYGAICFTPLALILVIRESQYVGEFQWFVERDFARRGDAYAGWGVLINMLGLVSLFAVPAWRGTRSPGQVLLGIYLVREWPISFPDSVIRSVLGFFTAGLAWLSLPIAGAREDKRMWFDKPYDTKAVVGSAGKSKGGRDAA